LQNYESLLETLLSIDVGNLYAQREELPISAASRGCFIAENLEAVKKHFVNNLDASTLSNQLAVLNDAVSGVSVKMMVVVSSTLAFTSNCNISIFVSKKTSATYVSAASYNCFCRAFFFILSSFENVPPNNHECQRLNH